MRSAPAIAFDLRPSRLVAGMAMLVVMAAAVSPWFSRLPWLACAALSAALLAIGGLQLRRFLWPPFRRCAWSESGWTLLDRDGSEHAALLESRLHLGPLLALEFRHGPRARFRFVIAADNFDAEQRRRLILVLTRVAADPPTLPRQSAPFPR